MSNKVSRILIVEDDEPHGEALRMALETEFHEAEMATSVDAALDRLRARRFSSSRPTRVRSSTMLTGLVR